MAWSTPRVWTTGELVTAAMLNTDIKNNTTDLHQRMSPTPAHIAAQETTTSTSYADLTTAGPQVTLTTGTSVMLSITAQMWGSADGVQVFMGYTISGATTQAAVDAFALISSSNGVAPIFSATYTISQGLTAGSNTFRAQYRVSSGTGTFRERRMVIYPSAPLP